MVKNNHLQSRKEKKRRFEGDTNSYYKVNRCDDALFDSRKTSFKRQHLEQEPIFFPRLPTDGSIVESFPTRNMFLKHARFLISEPILCPTNRNTLYFTLPYNTKLATSIGYRI